MSQGRPHIHGDVARDYPDYLRDESRRTGGAESISFPRTEAEVRSTLAELHARGIPVTVQCARTGVTAGAVPDGGHILSLSRMTRVTGLGRDPATGTFLVRVQPGVVLRELRAAIAARSFDPDGWDAPSRRALDELRAAPPRMFAPDPTETSAAVGGMVACNASGARSFRYGATRRYVHGLRIALADGDAIAVVRGRDRTDGRQFAVTTESGRTLRGEVPAYQMPGVKNASGYFAGDGMDLVDIFAGSEGTLGVFTGIELELIAAPPAMWAVTAFFPGEEAAIRFVRAARDGEEAARPCAIEFFDRRALDLLRRQKAGNPAFTKLPEIPASADTAIYVEYHAADDDAAALAVERMTQTLVACGGREDATWIATNEREMEPLHVFRHAVPEAVNLTIDERRRATPGLTKLGTDMAVPDDALEATMAMYHRDLGAAGLEYVIFGHIGNNHVHVNILPRDMAEYDAGKRLYLAWARAVIARGGSISAEHGVGKLKTSLLEEMYGSAGIAQMRAVKRLFDPGWRLNRGNLFLEG